MKVGTAILGSALLLSGCDERRHFSEQNPPYVLYKISPVSADRVHLATFDNPAEDENFNHDVCQATADIVNKVNSGGFHWWCEKAEEKSN